MTGERVDAGVPSEAALDAALDAGHQANTEGFGRDAVILASLNAALAVERPAIHSSVLEGLKAKLSEDLAADDFEQATVESLEEWFDAWAAASEGGERT